MKLICIDDTCKPNEVQQKNWIKKGVEYTALRLYRNPLSGDQFFALEEVQPDAPYAGYKVQRFSFDIDEFMKTFVEQKETVEEPELV
ncbi:hypothetical protein QNI19_13170 [Cytophagaceae bacterium DM2B3-1]|uniref:Uncharacterized protein n=2 Tax=Xanthocytophaga TaxID=3078918 RepID=A0AAE3QMB6_9BACT|nr:MULTISPECIES: hypothetical protein [Xanthocytophaga]MDJ1467809.1 hypothetical protein [Xanthocytophaga flavus]MDJ1479695.1 hypothetical protein [Xanthocytophaga flavus]MDJ1493887.1 hypothetical protein [Xanthocytophaga flavus]MDJ1501432.1 hypothetical protein [Xanthocytophaga agilis]